MRVSEAYTVSVCAECARTSSRRLLNSVAQHARRPWHAVSLTLLPAPCVPLCSRLCCARPAALCHAGDGDLGNEIIGWVGREGDKRFKERLREQQQLPLPPLPAPLDPDSRGAYPAAGGREAGLAGPAGPGGSAAGP